MLKLVDNLNEYFVSLFGMGNERRIFVVVVGVHSTEDATLRVGIMQYLWAISGLNIQLLTTNIIS
jgi:hypothetical protein